MNKIIKLMPVMISIVIVTSGLCIAQNDVVNKLNEIVSPISDLSDSENFSDIEFLKDQLTDKTVVALGEATHGTSEFTTFKSKIIKFLIQNLNFKTIIIEGDFAGCQQLNEYLTSPGGNLQNAMRASASGPIFTQEFVNLLKWIKNYNQDKGLSQQVKLFGCDMQFGFNSVNKLVAKEINLTASLSDEAQKGLEFLRTYGLGDISKDNKKALFALSNELNNASIMNTDPIKRKLQQQDIISILQTIDYVTQDHIYDKDKIRDKSMATNCEWIYDYTSRAPMIIWAHNEHICKSYPTDKQVLPMGGYLTSNFGDHYVAFGFSFSSGNLRTYNVNLRKNVEVSIPPVELKDSFDYIFGQCKYSNFILDISLATKDPTLSKFLNSNYYARDIGGNYDPVRQADGKGGSNKAISNLFDKLIFFRTTTAAHDPNFN